METSTPIGSPMRRKLSMKKNLIALENDEKDQEKELQNRRLEAINKSTELKRRSVAAPLPTKLNAVQLAEHCERCIQLSTENKINSKNAFNLMLIDFMAEMSKESSSVISQNFQVATNTLGVSVKIYGYRVDAVHTEAMKMAGGLASKALIDDINEADDSVDMGRDKGRKKRKKKMTVVPGNTLNVKSESEVLMDAAPKKTLLHENDEDSYFLIGVPKYNDGCVLMVEPDVPCWPFDMNQSKMKEFVATEIFDPLVVMDLFSNIEVKGDDKICEATSGIEFDLEIDEELDADTSQTSVFEFDVNASVLDVDYDEPVAAARLAVPCGGYDSGDDIALPPARIQTTSSSINDMKRRLSLQDKEYSMFDEKSMKAWAGPTYWKVRPCRESTSKNKENEDISQPIGAKRARRARVKEVANLCEFPDLSRHLTQTDKSILAKSTLCSWKSSAVTLSEDYKYSSQNLTTLFHLPFNVVPAQQDVSELEEILEDCPSQYVAEDHNYRSYREDNVNEVEEWDAENMIAPPSVSKKIQMTVFQKTKSVDITKLKNCIWQVITNRSEDKSENLLSFDELCQKCPEIMPKNVADSVTDAIMFNALLHLANEKSLVLTQKPLDDGFTIST